ncbi:putative cystathionine gamma-lyase 2 isoform X1 [Nomia melanderi]|uniref:putative cystathionine gamma-lyase 2 isoform X1 n=2 Tax=Nomia melanderi TaxID=2448451 RepID=UPI0013046A96|nr:putative cystathionine gamma-lyase 2 isoform X1 [Nomia melanderi]XP_031827560.1 putative cystathionine gamma-lyase 2 isoform X1 [Nomia melanderi]XP_031827561.1 putative cystathionine gamma-lyase 2 isoform X1 [Nomia melanderi]XP_031827562.1 putative cystathionine gamma-lyase 2 isoform X1 [Nomia melanderi]XP_031827564.1 putative cystathionine gamma-lyase 2 isoform X1 [Nomia melanderi]XP_031827565.1 putative cystathionine gamma-lyase 2 isoform X1 [Nomia melanderi]
MSVFQNSRQKNRLYAQFVLILNKTLKEIFLFSYHILNFLTMSMEEGFATKAIHAGQDPLQWSHSAVVAPIVTSTTYQQDRPGEYRGFVYGRSGNPSRNVLEKCLVALENGKHGFVFASGLGAIVVINSLLKAGDHIISGDDIYGGTNRLFRKYLSPHGIDLTFVDAGDVNNIITAVKPNTKMLWLETPTNPLLQIIDIKAVSETLKIKFPEIIIVVDNTFLTCYYQRPLELGADIVMYSLTKYMGGHSDVVSGAAVTRNDAIAEKLRFFQKSLGIVPSPFDCYLINRSLKTLELRMQQHMKNGLAVAKFLESHPYVKKVIHPYLPSHPQHELALRQSSGHSGMISFYLKGDSRKFLTALKVFALADSLGGPESLAELPSAMTHASLPEETRTELGITDQLIRLSVGLETERDILADLDQALKVCQETEEK